MLALKIDSTPSTGGQGRLTYFTYFPWPPLKAGLSNSTSSYYLNVV